MSDEVASSKIVHHVKNFRKRAMRAFECKMCGECCYGEGGIYLTKDEIESIAIFLNITPISFLSDYCEVKNGRTYIKTGENGFCIFFDPEKGCFIHPVKPGPCSIWPFYPALIQDEDNWEMAKDACPGINPECPFEDFVKQSEE